MRPSIKFFPHAFEEIDLKVPSAFGATTLRYPVWNTPKLMQRRNVQVEVDFYSRIIAPGDIVFDIGAHIGDSTLAFAVCSGITGTVYAFEPNPATFRILSDRALINSRVTKISPIPLAVGTMDCHTIFDYGDHWLDNGGFHEKTVFSHGSNYTVPVRMVELSSFLKLCSLELKDIKFIKLDCEGADLNIVERLIEFEDKVDLPCIQLELIEFNEKIAARLAALEATFDIHELSVDECGDLSCRVFDTDSSDNQFTKKDLILVPIHDDTLSLG